MCCLKGVTVLDLAKATVVCGSLSYLTYSYAVLGQAAVIGVLGLLWLFYARETVEYLRRR